MESNRYRMKNIGILQPGRIGDIFLCLPIAKFYNDLGYKVYWPVFEEYIKMFSDVVNYVHFLPVSSDVYSCIPQAKGTFLNYKVTKIIDLAATFPGSTVTERYVAEGDGFGKYRFDEFKYKIAQVPFKEKWNLQYTRDLKAEEDIYNTYVKSEKYDVFSLNHSRGKVNKVVESKHQLIELNEKHSIFHWRKVFENAQNICLVDSAVSNFVEQLNIKCKKTLIQKKGQPIATYNNNWRIIQE